MAVVRENMSPARHPWIEAFLANPDKEFADLLAGYARIEPYGRAETPDAARMLFRPLPPEDAARRSLDQAAAEWLEERRRDGVPPADGPRLDRKLREILDAIRIVSVLSLQQTAADFRRRFLLWNSWVERLAGIGGPDIRAEFLSALALTQRLVQKTASGINPFGLEPLWLSLCEQAGSQYPKSYLAIGLLGLRMLPERKDMPSERLWMAGLGRWASRQKPEVSDFSRQWWALRALYPSAPGHWREALADTWRQRMTENIPAAVRDFWEKDVGLGKPNAQMEDSRREKRPRVSLPPLSKVNSLLDRMAESFRNIDSELKDLIGQFERYAYATGDSYYLVRSATNIGMRLIEFGPTDELAERSSVAADLARKALTWSPIHVHAWALWRDALESQGRYEAAELVGWEEIRRFPEDPWRRSQVALFLSRFPDRDADTEHLLRETLNRFPQNTVAMSQLALLLARRPNPKDQDEAETLLRDVLRHDPRDIVACGQLGYLLAKRPDRKDQDEAETLLRDVLRRSGDALASCQLAYLLAKRPGRQDQDEAETLLRDVLRDSRGNILAGRQLGYLLARRPGQQDQDEAETLLRDVLRRSPGDIVASRQLAYLLAKRPDRKDQDEAEMLLREVLGREPGNLVASRQLANLLAKRPDRKDQQETERFVTEPTDLPADTTEASSQSTPSPAQQHDVQRKTDLPEESTKSSLDGHVRLLTEPAELPADIRASNSQLIPPAVEQLDVHYEMDLALEESIRSSLDEAFAQGGSITSPIVSTAPLEDTSAPSGALTPVPSPSGALPAATRGKARSVRADVDMTMALVRRGGRLRRLAADLSRKKDDTQWRRAAVAEIEHIFAEDNNFSYAQYLKNELGGAAATETRAVSATFAIAFIDAMKKKDPERFKNLESNHPAQSRLFDVARAYLFEDRAAADRVVRWLNAPADTETRSVVALRAFFEQRFGVRVSENKYHFGITDPATFLNLVATNDNVRLDLIESVLAPADLALAA